jgi:hypothetical protein
MPQRTRPPVLPVIAALAALWLAAARARADHPEREEFGIACTVSGNDVRLSWNIAFVAPIEGWVILRDGAAIARLGPQAMGYLDPGVPSGEHEYQLQAIPFDANSSVGGLAMVLGYCKVLVGDFGILCEVSAAGSVLIAWPHLRIDVQSYQVFRDGHRIATLPPDQGEYLDAGPAPGLNRYVVIAELASGHSLVSGACTVRVPPQGFACTVEGGTVLIDWSGVILPAIAFDHFAVVRNGEEIATTRESSYKDEPGPGQHHYQVFAVIEDPAGTNTPRRFPVGECRVTVGGDGPPPPQDLECAVAIPAGEPPPLIGNEILPGGFVSLTWKNPVPYDAILVARNGMPIAELPGNAQSFTDVPPSFQGRFIYEVRGVAGGEKSRAAVCEVTIGFPGLPPPENFHCRLDDRVLDPANDPNAPFPVVLLTWTNPARYRGIVVRRNGEELAKLPGDAMAYRDVAPPAGTLLYSLQGVGLDEVSAEVFCRVENGGLPPVRNLICAAQGTTAVLKWENPVAYDQILIRRLDRNLIVTLPGDATRYEDPGLIPGSAYTYSVSGALGGAAGPPAICRVLIEGPPADSLLFFSNSLVVDPRANGLVPVPEGDGTITCLARNEAAVQGWSFGVQSDPRFIVPASADIEDTATGKLNDGAGPTFLAINLERGGVTMAVVIDEEDPADTLPPPDFGHALLDLAYVAGDEGRPGVPYPVSYADTLGDPPVAIVFVVEGFEVRPATLDGFVVLPLRMAFYRRGDLNADGSVDMSDAVFELNWLFTSGRVPECLDAADSNASTQANIADPIYTLQFLFGGGPPLPPPSPGCGSAQPTLGCEVSNCAAEG